jgi:hypothetical protein
MQPFERGRILRVDFEDAVGVEQHGDASSHFQNPATPTQAGLALNASDSGRLFFDCPDKHCG